MNNLLLHRMTLDGDNLNQNRLSVDVESDVLAVEIIILLRKENLLVIKRNADSFLVAAVYDSRHLIFATLAASRTFP